MDMKRVPNIRGELAAARATEEAGSSSKLRLVLILTLLVAVGGLMVVNLGGSGGRLAGAASALGALLPGGATLTVATALIALLTGLVMVLRRRASWPSAALARVTKSKAEAPPVDDLLARLQGRGPFLASLDRALQAHVREGRQLAVHRIDVDHFRRINDASGIETGDAVLREVARRLASLGSAADQLGRLGDDEFAVIQPETGGARHAAIFAERIKKAFEAPATVEGEDIPLTASIGIAVAPDNGTEAERLLACADLALRAAQEAGGDALRFFSAELDRAVGARRHLQDAVRQGLENGWFVVRYQPQFDIGTGRLQGFEALLRLQHPQLGVVPAADFVPVAEEMGLMVPIGELAIREACRTAVRWPQQLRLAINLSPGQFTRGDIVNTLSNALTANHLSPPRVDLDVNERLFIGPTTARVSEQLRRLSDLGFRLVLDHLGSGRASPRDLHDHPLHAVKLDGSLVRQLGEERGADRLLTGLIMLAQSLDLQIMADGVEAADQVHFLMLNGCRHIQGRICGGVVSADRLRAIIAKDLKSLSEAGEAAGGQPAAAAA